MHLFRDLNEREKAGNPIMAGVVGCGFFGSGVVRQLVQTPGIRPAVIANRTPAKAVAALIRSGVKREEIRQCDGEDSIRKALNDSMYAVTSDLSVPPRVGQLEVITETTGDLLVGTQCALEAIDAGKHFVAANPETQATVGNILRRKADEAGVVYSDMDGDQPGIVKRLYDYVEGIGFHPVVAGNCKGVMKRYATPETQAAYSRANDIKPWIATAAADGTKLNIEMCIMANSAGLRTAKRGMTGVQTSQETILEDFARAGLLEGERIVEYTLGIPVGVFVIGKREDSWIQTEMSYFKMGQGPYYFFFSPHVLCQFDAVPSIAEAVLYHSPVITPEGKPSTEVAAFAKRNLAAGQALDGIGGFDLYGMLVNEEDLTSHDWVPVGLAHYFRLKKDVEKDAPLSMSHVEQADENILTRLYEEQRQFFFPSAVPSGSLSPNPGL